MLSEDTRVRLAAFEFLKRQLSIHGGRGLPRSLLAQGFELDGVRVPLLGPQGIFKPAILSEIPISFTTVAVSDGRERPYDDQVGTDGLIHYKYRGTDPEHRDNVGLRLAMHRHVPLIYFFGLVPGHYFPVWPVFVVGDDPRSLTFKVEVSDQANLHHSHDWSDDLPAPQRTYLTVSTQKRLHQRSFSARVLQAYRESCAVCRLRHRELLDGAHILPDGHPKGEPTVPNGLALCKLHHAAFDNNILGVRPDLVVEIREDILDEIDGPMLQHGLKGCHGQRLAVIPGSSRLKPNVEFLEERYEAFRGAS